MKKKFYVLPLIIIFCLCLFGCDASQVSDADSQAQTFSQGSYITVGATSQELCKKDYKSTLKQLESLGFTNITCTPSQTPIGATDLQEGDVTSVFIDGKSDFKANSRFLSDAQIVIKYVQQPAQTAFNQEPDTKDPSKDDAEQKENSDKASQENSDVAFDEQQEASNKDTKKSADVPDDKPTSQDNTTPLPDTKTESKATHDKQPQSQTQAVEKGVWIPQKGKKYHCDPSCSNMKNPSKVTLDEAQRRGYTACKRCY